MKQRQRIYYSAAQRSEIWDRWQRGESMSSIGRRFDRQSSSIFSVLSPSGGIRPAERRRSGRSLSLSEREEISRGLVAGRSLRAIAAQLGRAPSTISREVGRGGGRDRYRGTVSDQAAWDRALRPKLCKLACHPGLRRTVSRKLRRSWSPEQIAGWLIFTAIQIGVAALGILPASLLAIAAGLSYGLWLGFALSATGTLLGGWLAFLLSRSILRPWIAQLLMSRDRLAKFDAAVARDGWRFVCLMRVSPLMPFAATSYGLGLTGIDNRQFLLGTLASLPALLGYVATGALARAGWAMTQNNTGLLQGAMLALGLAATIFTGLRLQRMLRASLTSDPATGAAIGALV